ncbi:hypothetical protein BAG01nite_48360 [Brevibacillus agri]|uniref:Uncharacterized protein n=1 Tax=Brevibacillus agri TaxID=51101 RepID=A0A3M8ALB7_9BACL|nr:MULTISPECIES: hypothetical protein [Brevibacillus]MED3501744.1 hypothetical protein [Brevibacillus agri]QAV15768.1 hypothetical protein BA6348_25235 [Brevibacillus agri]QHZ58461.1 hypothetical protein M655_024025 [Brevibacillus sp. NSP2.1]RNB51981.1 hypothetical protein EB820_19445 [Brevibacillus agri]GED28734.1 hypothetical protein BAG01nite_48360 [Brevibacillus agri]
MIWILFLFILFLYLLLRQGNQAVDKSSYVPNPNGHWVNKGTDLDEEWAWWGPETNKISLYVSVLEEDGGYKILINDESPKNAIDFMDCDDKREAEIAVSVLTIYYTAFGNVTVSDLVGVDINKNLNGECI